MIRRLADGVRRAAVGLMLAGCGVLAATGATGALTSAAAAQDTSHEALQVVATIAPIHSLVAAVIGTGGETDDGHGGGGSGGGNPPSLHLLVRGAASPHAMALRPSDAQALQSAALVFWIGPHLETFLADKLATLAPDARIITLSEAPGVTIWPLRRTAAWIDEHDDHDHGHDGGEEGGDHADDGDRHQDRGDPHLWLDPVNGQAMVAAIVAALSAADPANRETYGANGAALAERLADLQRHMASELTPVRSVRFMVFHDSWQYLERRFALTAVGALALNPEVQPGAAHMRRMQAAIREHAVRCVFAEPQFTPRAVQAVIEGTAARTAVLDPLGADLAPGADLYVTLLRRNAAALAGCLGGP
ncbi:MAG: zinc ABC transporter substrate-binding protein [Alphaproteobacteria bacterium]